MLIAAPLPHANADYNITLGNHRFNVVWRINAWQNLTGFTGVTGTVFPANMSLSLSGPDLSSFNSSLQKAIQTTVSGVTVDALSVQVNSNSPTYSCPTTAPCPVQWFNLTAQFNVNENPSIQGGEATYDLSWKTFRIIDDLQATNQSFNIIGEKYLVAALIPLVNFPNGLGRSMGVTIGRLPVSNVTYVTPTRNIFLLDTSLLATPLENWDLTRDLAAGTQTWTSPDTLGFNAQGALRFTEASSITSFNYIARLDFSASISAPIGAFASQNRLSVDATGNLWEKTYFSIAIVSLLVLLATILIERRVGLDQRTRRKSTKRK